MRCKYIWAVRVMLGLVLILSSATAGAETGFSVWIQGNQVLSPNPPCTGQYSQYNSPHIVVLSNCDGSERSITGTSIKIAAGPGTGPARVVADDQNGEDHLTLVNAKIRSSAAPPGNCDAWDLPNNDDQGYVYCPDILFYADFDAGPNSSENLPVTFYRLTNGSLTKSPSGGAAGSSVRMACTVDGGGLGGPVGKEATTTAYTFDLPATAYWTGSGAREILGQVWFHLKFANTHYLNIEYFNCENPTGGGGKIHGPISVVGQEPKPTQCQECCVVCDQDKKQKRHRPK